MTSWGEKLEGLCYNNEYFEMSKKIIIILATDPRFVDIYIYLCLRNICTYISIYQYWKVKHGLAKRDNTEIGFNICESPSSRIMKNLPDLYSDFSPYRHFLALNRPAFSDSSEHADTDRSNFPNLRYSLRAASLFVQYPQ